MIELIKNTTLNDDAQPVNIDGYTFIKDSITKINIIWQSIASVGNVNFQVFATSIFHGEDIGILSKIGEITVDVSGKNKINITEIDLKPDSIKFDSFILWQIIRTNIDNMASNVKILTVFMV
jgi:hypothetical protein